MRNHTGSEGPVTVGFAHGDYTVAEIKEALEANAGLSDSDQVAIEQARRKVRVAGHFTGLSTDEVLNDGKMLRTRLNFRLGDSDELAIWAYNQNGAALTTGSVVECMGKLYAKRIT